MRRTQRMAILSEVKSKRLLFALVALSMLELCSPLQEDVYVVEDEDHPKRRIVFIVTRTNEEAVNCTVICNKTLIEEFVASPADYDPIKLPEKRIQRIIEECSSISTGESDDCDDYYNKENQLFIVDEAKLKWDIIFPGTKWCGMGDIAEDYNDLGVLNETDCCCRSHDNCNDTILAGETSHNLTNVSYFTALSCQCDDAFSDCLTKVNTVPSNTIIEIYFDILRLTCFSIDYPYTSTCKTYLSFLHIICREYERNTTVPKAYMWR